MLHDIESSTAALCDGGWRSDDVEELASEYGLEQSDAAAICEKLKEYEWRKQDASCKKSDNAANMQGI